MIRIVRTRTLNALRTSLTEAQTDTEAARQRAEAARAEAEACLEQSGNLLNCVERAEDSEQELRAARDRAIADTARLEGELETLRAQSLLDTEDRQALRTLLRITRRQHGRAEVYVLFRFGELHSVHATADAAEIAAEAEGAARHEWTRHTTRCDGTTVPASEIRWRIQPVQLGGTR